MKINTTDYAYMREAMRAKFHLVAAHRARLVEQHPERYGLDGSGDIEKRVRHDLLHAAGLSTWICDNLYRKDGKDTGINDAHIDTALRAIMRELGGEA